MLPAGSRNSSTTTTTTPSATTNRSSPSTSSSGDGLFSSAFSELLFTCCSDTSGVLLDDDDPDDNSIHPDDACSERLPNTNHYHLAPRQQAQLQYYSHSYQQQQQIAYRCHPDVQNSNNNSNMSADSGDNPDLSIIIDGFAIDSDEENDDDEGVVDVSIDNDPLTDAASKDAASAATSTTSTTTAGGVPAPSPVPPSEDPLLHPLHEDVVHTVPNQQQQQQHLQQQPPVPSSVNSLTQSVMNMATGMASSSEGLESQFKASTSRFASNLANMAQRAATAVSTAQPMQPQPNHMMYPPQQHQQLPSMMINGNTLGVGQPPLPGGMTQQQPLPPQSPSSPSGSTNPMSTAPLPTANPSFVELDNDQKAALVEQHVGGLLPGERVIMFLSNLLHVADSTGFSYSSNQQQQQNNNNSSSNQTIWCCAMTYYRLILFGTTHDHMLHVRSTRGDKGDKTGDATEGDNHNNNTKDPPPPNFEHPFQPPSGWNASCWPPAAPTVLEMPLTSMEKVEKTVYTTTNQFYSTAGTPTNSITSMAFGRPSSTTNTAGGTTVMGLHVQNKDGRQWRFSATSYADTVRAHQALGTYAFPGRRNLGYLFAFESKRAEVVNSVVTDPTTGQKTVSLALFRKRFDAVTEYQRQMNRGGNVSSSGGTSDTPPQPWKIWTQINQQYQLCNSYPNILVGPASLDDASPDAVRLIQQCAAFRSGQRLPSLSWCSGVDGASIWRASQPKIGLQGNRSSADELVLKHIMEAANGANALRDHTRFPLPVIDTKTLQQLTGSSEGIQGGSSGGGSSNWMREAHCALKILDLRPRSAAMANRTGGYGYENTSNYPGTTLQFCNIGNIHAVRDSYQKLTALCLGMTSSNSSYADVNWGSAVEDTKWLSHIRLILAAAWETAYWVQVHRMPVLLHCSHGWDRTSQVSALAQLFLDPYFRTMEGFACLVDKDFMSFGHPFHTRCAHGEGKGGADSGGGGSGVDPGGPLSSNGGGIDEGQISPIFIQFLDCVWQMVQQYPECFEFTARYVLELSNHVYSCRFGNMLCDTERERELVAGIRQRTYSVWDYLQDSDEKHFTKWQNPKYNASDPNKGGGVLLMPLPTLLRNVKLWVDKHAQHGSKPTQRWRNSIEN